MTSKPRHLTNPLVNDINALAEIVNNGPPKQSLAITIASRITPKKKGHTKINVKTEMDPALLSSLSTANAFLPTWGLVLRELVDSLNKSCRNAYNIDFDVVDLSFLAAPNPRPRHENES